MTSLVSRPRDCHNKFHQFDFISHATQDNFSSEPKFLMKIPKPAPKHSFSNKKRVHDCAFWHRTNELFDPHSSCAARNFSRKLINTLGMN